MLDPDTKQGIGQSEDDLSNLHRFDPHIDRFIQGVKDASLPLHQTVEELQREIYGGSLEDLAALKRERLAYSGHGSGLIETVSTNSTTGESVVTGRQGRAGQFTASDLNQVAVNTGRVIKSQQTSLGYDPYPDYGSGGWKPDTNDGWGAASGGEFGPDIWDMGWGDFFDDEKNNNRVKPEPNSPDNNHGFGTSPEGEFGGTPIDDTPEENGPNNNNGFGASPEGEFGGLGTGHDNNHGFGDDPGGEFANAPAEQTPKIATEENSAKNNHGYSTSAGGEFGDISPPQRATAPSVIDDAVTAHPEGEFGGTPTDDTPAQDSAVDGNKEIKVTLDPKVKERLTSANKDGQGIESNVRPMADFNAAATEPATDTGHHPPAPDNAIKAPTQDYAPAMV